MKLLPFLLLVGCPLIPDDGDDDKDDTSDGGGVEQSLFPDQFGATLCTRLKECDDRWFDRTWGSQDDCREEGADIAECFDGCDFDADAAQACLDEIEDASCRDIERALDDGDYEACDSVYSCTRGQQELAEVCAAAASVAF